MTEATAQIEWTQHRRYRAYPKYRDSGIDWLGEIPVHWNLKRLKNSVARLESGGTPESDNVAYWTDDEQGIPWVAIADMTRDFRIHVTAKRITDKGRMSKNLRVLPVGTLLYSMYASLGKVALLETEAVINQAILGVVPHGNEVFRDYLRWWFEFMEAHVQMLSSSNTQDNLSAERVRNMPVALPRALDEQRAIADFLDREAAKIDALVARKEQLIELLQEKRTALITRAVTRGLDPHVPMKDSGVEWLGEIPAHWVVKRFKNVCAFVTSGSRGWADYYADDGPLFLRIGDLQSGSIDLNLDDAQHVDPPRGSEGERTRVTPGDVVVSITALIGAVGVVPEDLPEAFVNQHLALIRLSTSEADSRWIAYCIMSPVGQTQFAADLYGGTKDGLGLNDIRSLLVLAPPIREQERIVAHLDSQSTKLTTLVASVRRAIDHLREFRTALISAAVTGKIDVREAVPR